MDRKRPFLLIDILKDVFKHHRKITAFQKTVALSCFLGVLILIFRNLWILGLFFCYCCCLYLSVVACRYIVDYHSYFPSDLILALLESFERLFENGASHSQLKLDNTSSVINRTKSSQHDKINANSGDDEFFDACDELQLNEESQSTFYVDLDRDMSLEECDIKHEIINTKAMRQKYSDHISTSCPPPVQKEIDKMLTFIERDFIESWYHLFSKHFESLDDADMLLHEIVVNILQRILKVDIKNIARILMCMFSNHVKRCKEARMIYKVQSKRRRKSSVKPESDNLSPKLSPAILKSLEECFASKVDFHTALKSRETEYLYLNSLVELLLIKLMPDHLNDSKALVCALREIISFNVLSTVMNLLCDPTFLHERIIKITSDEVPGDGLVDSPVLLEMCQTMDNNKDQQSENTNIETSPNMYSSTILSEEDKNLHENPFTEHRKSSFLDDTELHFVPREMCNECNRLCSKDRDKIEPHQHTCSLGREPCFLNVKSHDTDQLSVSSGEGSPVFKFYISDTDTTEESSGRFTQHSNSHDIPSGINDSPDITPDKISLQKVPEKLLKSVKDQHLLSETSLKETNKNMVRDSGKKRGSLDKTDPRDALAQGACINHSQGKTFEHSIAQPVKALQTTNTSTDTQESKFFQGFGGNLFSFKFPQFGNKPLKEKNRSLSDLDQVSDAESEDFTPLRKSKSSTEFGANKVVSGHEALLYPAEAPLPFQDVHIEKTETAKEAGSLNPYTLYVIEYEAIHPTDEGIFVHRSGKVKRRFREFVNLQLRLEDNPLYKKSLKDIKGPRKWLSLPFGNMDKDSIESRRKILSTFLTSLIKKEDICQGPELKEFLGYTGDGHIAFVRKVPENIGPRIDQRLVKTMSGMFDKIVEVLPSLPNELPRIIKTDKPRDDVEPDKLVEDADQIDLETKFDDDDLRRSDRLHKALDDFVKFESLSIEHSDHDGDHNTTLGTSVLEWQEAYSQNGSAARNQPSDVEQTNTQADTKTAGQDIVPLCNALLDILSELLYGHDSWMCRESVMKSIKIIAGRALERYLNSKIDFLVSAEMDTFYLETLRETVWPDDQLSTESRPNYTDGQKEGIKKQAARCLGNFLPGALHTLLGEEDFDLTVDEIMECIKCEKLNRHFWYSFLDVLVEHIFPEIKTEEIQRKLSRS